MAFGIWGAVTGVAVGLGPVLGGVITTGISWRGIFLVNLPIGVAALAITRWQVDESKTPHAARPDWAGFATLTAGLVSLVYGLIRAGEIAWSDTGVVICLVLAVVFLGAFVVVERRAEHPLFDLSLFRIPTFSGGLAAAFAMNGSLYAMLLYLVLYLQDDLGYSALGTGLRLLVMSGVTLVTATIAGRLSTHMPVRWLIGPGLLLVGVGLLLMTGLDGASSWTHLIPGFIVAGAGSGMVNPPLASTAVGVVTPQRSGMASGVNTTFRQIGIATGIAVYGSIFASSLHHKLDQALAGTPSLHRHLPRVVAAVQQGNAAPGHRRRARHRSGDHWSPPSTPASPAPSTFCSSSVPSWPLSERPVPLASSGPGTSWPPTSLNRLQHPQREWPSFNEGLEGVFEDLFELLKGLLRSGHLNSAHPEGAGRFEVDPEVIEEDHLLGLHADSRAGELIKSAIGFANPQDT